MNINSLVPPVDLCKKIPDGIHGNFHDCAFCWHYTDTVGFICRTSGCEQVQGKEWQIVPNHRRKIEIRRNHGEEIYPAPTLQEILKEMASGSYRVRINYDYFEGERFEVAGERGSFQGTGIASGRNANIAEAALRAWLDEMGIDV